MKAVVKNWGNSASVRVPAAVVQAAKLRLDDSVDVREESPAALSLNLSRARNTPSPNSSKELLWRICTRKSILADPWAKRPGDAACLCARRRRHCLQEDYRFAPKASRRPSIVKGSGEWRENEEQWPFDFAPLEACLRQTSSGQAG